MEKLCGLSSFGVMFSDPLPSQVSQQTALPTGEGFYEFLRVKQKLPAVVFDLFSQLKLSVKFNKVFNRECNGSDPVSHEILF